MFDLVQSAALGAGANVVNVSIPEGTDWTEAVVLVYSETSSAMTSVSYRYLDSVGGNVLKGSTSISVTNDTAERALEPAPVIELTITMSGEGGVVNVGTILKR